MNFSDVRAKFPQYDDLSDEALATALHNKFYPDMSFLDFAGKIGYSPGPIPIPEPVQPATVSATPMESLGMGVGDPFYGIQQAGARLPEWARTSPITGETTITPEQADITVQQREAEYRPPEGFDIMRMLGNVAGTTPTMVAAPAGVGGGMVAGALGAGSMPVTEGDFGEEKLKQTALGAGIGGATAAIPAALGRVMFPKAAAGPQAQLSQSGVRLTPGQALGGGMKSFEEKLTSVPVLGDLIKRRQGQSIEDFNKLVYDYVLEPIGKKARGPVGHKGVANLRESLSDRYEDVLSRMTFKADQQFADEYGNFMNVAKNEYALGEKGLNRLKEIGDDLILDRMEVGASGIGTISGNKLKKIQSALSKRINTNLKADDADQNSLGEALKELQGIMRSAVERSNPEYAGPLSSIDRAFARFKRVEEAAGLQGAKGGVFTPNQYAGRVRMGRGGAGKSAYARGQGFGQDLAEAGREVIGDVYPDSGTAGRIIGGALAGGPALINPSYLAAPAAATLGYLPGIAPLIGRSIASRPAALQPIAAGIRAGAPFTGLTGAMTAENLRR